jgi:hypothetical protein
LRHVAGKRIEAMMLEAMTLEAMLHCKTIFIAPPEGVSCR